MSDYPAKLLGPNLEEVLNAAGFYRKNEWRELTDDEIETISGSFTESEGFNQGAQWANEELKRRNS